MRKKKQKSPETTIFNNQINSRHYNSKSPFILLLLVIFFSLIIGWGMAKAIATPSLISQLPSNNSEAPGYELGKQLYLENCGTCHTAIAAEVLPTETWKELLTKPQVHYGEQIPELISVTQLLVWEYLRTFSRPLAPGQPTPVYVDQSRFFKALHPKIDLPKPTTHRSCTSCHPNANQLDYQTLTSEWENE